MQEMQKQMLDMKTMMMQMMAGGGVSGAKAIGTGGLGGGKSSATVKPGDWTCPSCGDNVFASRMACKMCGTPRPGMVPGMKHPNAKPGDWTCPECFDLVFANKEACRCGVSKSVATEKGLITAGKPGDWTCSSCNMFNFSSRGVCKQCELPRTADQTRVNMKVGDWICPGCGDLVFASRSQCKMCSTAKPEGAGCSEADATWTGASVGGNGLAGRPGDWACPACNMMNFSSRTTCKQCDFARPVDRIRMGQKPGDWICQKCGDLVFASKVACKMCGSAKPTEGVTGVAVHDASALMAQYRANPYGT